MTTATHLGAVAVLALVWGTTGRSVAQCCGDCDGNGAVAVNELVRAVSYALGGCAATPQRTATSTRTPTRAQSACPFDFRDDTIGGSICFYRGPAITDCFGTGIMQASWSSNGRALVIAVFQDDSGSIGVMATRTSAVTARVNEVSFGPDFDNPIPATGALQVPSGIEFMAGFDAGPCLDFAYDGIFQHIIGTPNVGLSSGIGAGIAAMAPAGSALGASDETTIEMRRLMHRLTSGAPLR